MFNTDELLSALDELGEAAVAAGERLDVDLRRRSTHAGEQFQVLD